MYCYGLWQKALEASSNKPCRLSMNQYPDEDHVFPIEIPECLPGSGFEMPNVSH